GKHIDEVAGETLARLCAYPWPGNVRELENIIERSVILANGPILCIDADIFGSPPVRAAAPEGDAPPESTMQGVEREYVLKVLQQTGWVVDGPRGAAKILGLHPNTLRSRMKKLGIQRQGP